MKRSCSSFARSTFLLVFSSVMLTGCGNGHPGGPIDTSENPFQVTESEQQRMNAANRVSEEAIEQAAENSDSIEASDTPLEALSSPAGDGGDSYDPQ